MKKILVYELKKDDGTNIYIAEIVESKIRKSILVEGNATTRLGEQMRTELFNEKEDYEIETIPALKRFVVENRCQTIFPLSRTDFILFCSAYDSLQYKE